MRGQGVEGLEVVNVSFLQELLSTIADQGRALLPRSLFGAGAEADVEELARVLISGRGEASGFASRASCSTGTHNSTPTTGSRSSAFSRPSCAPTRIASLPPRRPISTIPAT